MSIEYKSWKFLLLCFTEKRQSFRIGMTWKRVHDDNFHFRLNCSFQSTDYGCDDKKNIYILDNWMKWALVCSIQQPTSQFVNTPRWWFRWIRKSHIIFCIDSVVFSTGLDRSSVHTVQTVSYCTPNMCVGITFIHQVIQSIVFLLVWRWNPCDYDFTINNLFQLHWTWRLWFICRERKEAFMLQGLANLWGNEGNKLAHEWSDKNCTPEDFVMVHIGHMFHLVI